MTLSSRRAPTAADTTGREISSARPSGRGTMPAGRGGARVPPQQQRAVRPRSALPSPLPPRSPDLLEALPCEIGRRFGDGHRPEAAAETPGGRQQGPHSAAPPDPGPSSFSPAVLVQPCRRRRLRGIRPSWHRPPAPRPPRALVDDRDDRVAGRRATGRGGFAGRGPQRVNGGGDFA